MTDFRRERILVGGDWIQADAGGRIEVTNPATGAVIGTVPDAGAAETARAVAAAEAAFGPWRALTAAERATHLRRLAQAILDHREALAELLTEEQGKPLAEARGEVGMSAAYIQWFAEEARRVYGEVIPSPWPDRRLLVTRQPVGVVAAITPWNFPSSMLARKIGPALAAGCTVVAKPASQTPFSGLAWGVLGEMAGLPAGVLNIVTGSARAIGGEPHRQPHGAQDHLHRLHPRGQGAARAGRGHGEEDVDGASAATRPSSSSTMPISTAPSRAPSPPSSAMRARPASAPTASTRRPASTMNSSSGWPRPPPR